jgi:nucleotide-binding universal stress UspA family protein
MNASQYILRAVDDSEVTARAVTYVASIIEGQPGVRLCLLHVFAPLPPKLLEFGGAENPAEEERREAVQTDARTQWIARAKASAEDIFAKAQSILCTAGVLAHAVETQLATPLHGEAVVTNILEAARANQCGTVVVGRDSFSWLQELFNTMWVKNWFAEGKASPSGSSSRRRRGGRHAASEGVLCCSSPRPKIRRLTSIIP